MKRARGRAALVSSLGIAVLAGCAQLQAPSSAAHAPVLLQSRGAGLPTVPSPIQHVVILIQENRTVDNLFQGYPGANTSPTGLDHKGNVVTLQPVRFEAAYDILHGLRSFLVAYDNGKNDGFDREKTTNHPTNPHPQYGYVPQDETALYFAMAQQYVLNDNTFSSQIDGSFTAHQYLIAAQSMHAVNFPAGGWGCPSGIVHTLNQNRTVGATESACFGNSDPTSYPTLGDELDAAGLAWRYYAPSDRSPGHVWLAYTAVDHIFNGPDWSGDIVEPQTQVLSDVAGGNLSAVTWVVPDVADSDHSGPKHVKGSGPQWIASVVDAVGQSQFWNTTAIFVIWDDWGGWYDHVPPPQLDYDGLGFRVPLLCISPYAKQNYVSHVQLESASVVRFVEDNFGLATMSTADARATDAGSDCLDFSQQPRPFVSFDTGLAPSFYRDRKPSAYPPDDE